MTDRVKKSAEAWLIYKYGYAPCQQVKDLARCLEKWEEYCGQFSESDREEELKTLSELSGLPPKVGFQEHCRKIKEQLMKLEVMQ